MPKFCPGCGIQLTAGNGTFCQECGENISIHHEQLPVKDSEKKDWIQSAFKIVGLSSIFVGFLIVLAMYAYPVTEVLGLLGQGITLAQLHSHCENPIINALSAGSCSGVQFQFYFQWVIAVLLILAGLAEVLYFAEKY